LKPQNPYLAFVVKKKFFKWKQVGGSKVESLSKKRPFPKPNQGMLSIKNNLE